MNVIEDAELLRRFAAKRAEDAFAELVKRHLNLVYSATLRQVGGDHQLAEEVAQSVFADLARKAESLSGRESLAGWLYTSAHHAAAKVVRGEQRRRLREQEAHHMQETNASSGVELQWEQLQPVIDDAMHELPEADREAILQRYFEKQPFLQIGVKLGLTENAARMRVERALEKLRGILASRGVASTNVALAAVLGAQAVSAAPAALSATVMGTSLAAVAGGVATVWSIFTAAKLKLAVPVACAVAAVVALFMQQGTLDQLRKENAALLSAQQATENNESPVASNDSAEAERLRREKLELLKLRGEVGRMRREMTEMIAARSAGVVSNETAEVQGQKDSTQQINVKARFFTGTDEALELFRDDGGISYIEALEMSKLLNRLEKSDNVELLASQQVTTLSGRQAQITSSEFRTNAVTDVVAESSHIVDVLPTFLGGSGLFLNLAATKVTGRPILAEGHSDSSLPAPSVSQMIANVGILDGQTVAIAKQFDGKKLVVFVTPTLIDPAGNPVHAGAEKATFVEPEPVQQ